MPAIDFGVENTVELVRLHYYTSLKTKTHLESTFSELCLSEKENQI